MNKDAFCNNSNVLVQLLQERDNLGYNPLFSATIVRDLALLNEKLAAESSPEICAQLIETEFCELLQTFESVGSHRINDDSDNLEQVRQMLGLTMVEALDEDSNAFRLVFQIIRRIEEKLEFLARY